MELKATTKCKRCGNTVDTASLGRVPTTFVAYTFIPDNERYDYCCELCRIELELKAIERSAQEELQR